MCVGAPSLSPLPALPRPSLPTQSAFPRSPLAACASTAAAALPCWSCVGGAYSDVKVANRTIRVGTRGLPLPGVRHVAHLLAQPARVTSHRLAVLVAETRARGACKERWERAQERGRGR
jgi:hypothetical protein